MRILTPGEVRVGDFIVCYEYVIDARIRPIQGAFGGETGEYAEENEKKILIKTPWLKGIPFEVIGISLPILMVRNFSILTESKPLSPTVFMDTRMCHFLEVDKEYCDAYIKAEQATQKTIFGQTNSTLTLNNPPMQEFTVLSTLPRLDKQENE